MRGVQAGVANDRALSRYIHRQARRRYIQGGGRTLCPLTGLPRLDRWPGPGGGLRTDGAKALSKVIRRTFGAHTPIQRCQIHKARNVERLPTPLHASVRRALRQAWELDDADKAEGMLRNLARRLVQQAAGVAASGSNLTFESWKGFPSGSLHASLAHANRNFDFSQAC